jgi:hypothetical protein
MELTVCRESGRRFGARTSDVSVDGMGLYLTHEAVLALAQGGNLLTPGDAFDVVLSPNVEDADAIIGPRLGSRVRHVRRLARDEFLVGIRFNDLDSGQRAAIQAIVDRAQANRLR